ncbi:predicted protein [Nematostella vectensis]|uniref:Mab-21-like nucleotidyltransferase domain-containing protein n=2 Tax=Nematostella vectensis TaxID=45351 RepID=A7RP16_NEMVE|nr:predicted protein [Nematostella vectensis]|eukprot:XP_001638899.1 predicted protein [Nematostella vectensis]
MATCCSLDAELASKHDSIQEQTDKVLKNARCRSHLNHYLDELDRKFSVDLRDQEVINIRKDMEYIASQFAKKVACHDARFKGEILNSGSHYEGLQVSAPDEFDYMIEIEELSKQSMVDFRPTTDSGFFYGYSKASNRWKDCISLFCTDHNQPLRLQSICPLCSNNSKLYQRILDPEKVQDVFRKIADEVMEELLLPKYWEHGGFNRPRFSGHRKHGPATMFQLIYRTEKEIKINIDITLAIKVPKPTPSVVLQSLKIMRQEPCSSRMDVRILLGTDPGVHMIPLYSKMMLQKRKYAKKHAWRLSTSLVEGRIFQELGYDALPSRAIRVMKILRKEYLTYFSRKTVRQRRPRKTAAKKNKASQKEQVRNQIEDDTTDLTDNDEDESSKTKNYFIKGAITELQKVFEDLDVTFDPVVMKREQY